MKKAILLLAVALALAMIPCAALAASGDANIARYADLMERCGDYVRGGCALDGALYLYGQSHLFAWRPGDADVTALEFALPEADEGEERALLRVASDGDGLWALCARSELDDGDRSLLGAELWPLEIDGGAARFGDAVELDIDELTWEEGGQSAFVQVNDACWIGDYLALFVYDPYFEPAVYVVDTRDGDGWYVDDLGDAGDVEGIAAFGDQLLIEVTDYGAHAMKFFLYDPERDALESACAPVQMAQGADEPYGGFAYSERSGQLFYLTDGHLMAAEGFDFADAETLSELSMAFYDLRGSMLLSGGCYVCVSNQITCVRPIEIGAPVSAKLVVQDPGNSDAVTAAFYGFGSVRGDVSVAINRESWDVSRMVEAMMNRDDSRDIFVLSVSDEAYGALFDRGFMAELDDAAITSAVARMYPAVRAAITRNGAVMAVPVSAYGWLPALDYEGFEKIGIARADVPDTWKGLLELLPELPAMLPEDGSVHIFSEYSDADTVRSEFITQILECWRTQFNAAGMEPRYDDPELAELLNLAMGLDYGALGLSDYGDEYEFDREGGRSYVLFKPGAGCTLGSFRGEGEPALLRAKSDLEPCIPLQVTVAFVNPYSKQRDAAQAFLAELLSDLAPEASYNLSDAQNEPLRDSRARESLEKANARLEELRSMLASASAVNAPAIEEEIAAVEREIEELEASSWRISAESIAWYRAHAAYLSVDRYNYLNAAEGGELSGMIEQLLAGRMDAPGFLKEADRMARMRQMEGN